jgi:hypothetical protein
LIASLTGALAKDCEVGKSDRLELLAWASEPAKNGPYIRFRLRSNLAKAVLSISAKLVFENEAGDLLVEMPVSPDLRIAAGAERAEQDTILNSRMNDLLDPETVTAKICTRYVLYADGLFEEF